MRLHYKILTFAILISSAFAFNSCEIFEDILDDHNDSKRDNFVGVWKNDSLETKVYINGELFQTTKQSLKGSTFEMRKDSTYTTASNETIYLNGTWGLLVANKKYKIILDKGEALERIYDVKVITKHKLITNRVVKIDDATTEEYTFSYNK